MTSAATPAALEDVDRATVLSYASRIPWSRYTGAGAGASGAPNAFVEASDVALIQRFADEPQTRVSELLAAGDTAACAYPRALLKVLHNVADVRVIQYTLTLICDFLEADPERRVRCFFAPAAGARGGEGSPASALPFLQLVGTSGSGARIASVDANPYVLEHAARAGALLLSSDARDDTAVSSMLAWALSQLKLFGSASPRQVKVTEVRVRG